MGRKKKEKNSSATHASLGRQRIDTLAQDDAAILTIHYPVSRIIAAHASFRPICNRAVGLPLFSLAASQEFNHLVNLIRRLLIIRSSLFRRRLLRRILIAFNCRPIGALSGIVQATNMSAYCQPLQTSSCEASRPWS